MIPSKFLSKIGIHELEIEGVKVKACHVTDMNSSVLEEKITQLKASVDESRPVVGVDVKGTLTFDDEICHRTLWFDEEDMGVHISDLLILFAGNCCLVINLTHLSLFPDSLVSFLADKNICFIGTQLKARNISRLHSCAFPDFNNLSLSNVVEVRDLATSVLKKSNLSDRGLQALDNEVRNTASSAAASSDSCPQPDSKASVLAKERVYWKARAFSDEEMKYVIHDAHKCYVIGDKLLGIVDAVN
ncbi:hypothetical protein ACOSQ3_008945 [Xanthoceras sorbifolium]